MSTPSVLDDRLTENQSIALTRLKEQLVQSANLFRRNRTAMLGLAVVVAVVFMAIFAPYLTLYDPDRKFTNEQGAPMSLAPPSLEHPMGTDYLARDVFSRWVYGSQVSMLVAVFSGAAVISVGSTVGLFAGYYKGLFDQLVMRFVDVLYGIPSVILILLIAMFWGNSVWNLIIAMALVLWRTMARVVRSQTLSIAERPFVKAAKATGASDLRIIYLHITPNVLPLILIEGTFVMGAAILTEAGISFLGLGANEMISWGVMLNLTYSTGALTHAWWWVLPPGLSITILVVSFFYISRGLEEITNPDLQMEA
jgi:peptide/nickel transport system permease protein